LKKLNVRSSKSQIHIGGQQQYTIDTINGGEMRIDTEYSPLNQTHKAYNRYKQLPKTCSSRPRSVKMNSLSSRENKSIKF
jgi:hypothetical protein